MGPWKQTAIFIPLCWALIAAAEQIPFPELRVVKKPGEQTGSALVTIKGKPKILARHGGQAWQIMDNENALVLVASRKKTGGDEYHLRFYEGITREYRDLGTMPFAATELVKQRTKHIQHVLVEAAKLAPRQDHDLALVYETEKQRGNTNRATLAVARKMVAYLLAVDRGKRDFVPAEDHGSAAA